MQFVSAATASKLITSITAGVSATYAFLRIQYGLAPKLLKLQGILFPVSKPVPRSAANLLFVPSLFVVNSIYNLPASVPSVYDFIAKVFLNSIINKLYSLGLRIADLIFKVPKTLGLINIYSFLSSYFTLKLSKSSY